MGKIKSVNSANVAEFVQERKTVGNPTEPPVTETTPEMVGTPEDKTKGTETAPAEKKKNGVQERIDELTRQKKELDEFAQSEYEARLQLQNRVKELEGQVQSVQSPKPEVKEEPEPDPAKYTDQATFLKDWGEWNRKKAIQEFQQAEEKRKAEEEKSRLIAESNARKESSLKSAREQLPDFDEVIKEGDRSTEMGRIAAPTPMVAGLLSESDYQAHILYHLIKNPDEVAKLNKMRPAQAAIAIGRLENQFAKEPSSTESTPKPKLPDPTPTLATGGGNAPLDLNQPMSFNDYKQRRLDEIRKKRR